MPGLFSFKIKIGKVLNQMKMLVLVNAYNMLLLECLFPGICPNVRSLRNNRRQPGSGNIYDKNVSLRLGSSLYVFWFSL